jgi:UPF0716 protein FxsA
VPLTIFVLLVVCPAVELFVIVQVAHAIGFGWTLLLLVAAAALGIFVMRVAGASWWGALRGQTRTADGVVVTAARPDTAAAGRAALLFLAGLLLLLPGFISDLVGLVLLLPPVRAMLAAGVASWFARRFTAVTGPGGVRVWTRTTETGGYDVRRDDGPRPDDDQPPHPLPPSP